MCQQHDFSFDIMLLMEAVSKTAFYSLLVQKIQWPSSRVSNKFNNAHCFAVNIPYYDDICNVNLEVATIAKFLQAG